jgi:hypothetical protein
VFEKRKKAVIHRKNKKRSVEALRTAMAGIDSYMRRMDCSMIRASSPVTRKSLNTTDVQDDVRGLRRLAGTFSYKP